VGLGGHGTGFGWQQEEVGVDDIVSWAGQYGLGGGGARAVYLLPNDSVTKCMYLSSSQ
jgi:hypothetical protein